jgi:hypothetical protein
MLRMTSTSPDFAKAEDTNTPSQTGATSTEFLEIGSSGLAQSNGFVEEEFLRNLQGRKGIAVYREMRDNDPVIGAILHAIEMMMRGSSWAVEPADDSEQAADIAEFVGTVMNDMNLSWEDMVSQILSMLVYGWSYFEVVYKERKGATDDSATRSKYNDGMIGWRKLAPRSQETLMRWDFDEDGGLNGMVQFDPYAQKGQVFLPIEKSLLFRTTANKGDPEGRSILRNAYAPWYYKTRIAEIEAIGIERDLAGLPVAFVPPQLLSDNATAQEKAALAEIKKIVRNIKRDEQEGLVYPLAYDPQTGNLAYDIKLLSSGGDRQFSTGEVIGRYEKRMAMSVLADFIMLGHEKVGTSSLATSKITLFTDSLNAWLTGVSGVFSRHAFPRLIRLNGLPEELAPTLKHLPVMNVDLDGISAFLLNLSNSGATMFPDENLESYLRDLAGLPASEDSEQL